MAAREPVFRLAEHALTLLSVLVVWFIITEIGPWLMNTVWNAGSLRECREILDGTSGACFAVIKDRWHQLMFGFYPQDLYWRPVLAFVLMLVAVAPILFAELPRKMLYFSGCSLLSGITCFGVDRSGCRSRYLMGFVAGYVAFRCWTACRR